ncbi:MAG: phosphoenolpyruvate carboxykinase (ATP) [Oscillospiraceae bacterium]|nr:phosphoenolpyruvate carboxykinase (ATP) [Oscillospiraceae bacterium]
MEEAMAFNLEELGIINTKQIHRNLSVPALVEKALARGEGTLADNGALCVFTGKYTGRSPDDKFVADDASIHDLIDWNKENKPIDPAKFDAIYRRITAYLQNRELFVFDGYAGADPDYRVNFRIVNEMASQNLFIHQLLIRPELADLADYAPEFTIIAAPGFKCIPELDGIHSEAAILVSFERKMVLIAGSQYSGEIKKSVFSVMNFILPQRDVFTMHCSANVGDAGDSALFFGLSGTGKTTLSADPDRNLIGDDEHGWSKAGIFNIEGGCYAKCIKLSKENEPQIWDAIRFGSLVENVVIDPETRALDYDDGSITENTRVGYPVEYIPNAQIPGVAGHPKTVIFLTADAFGVLPPVSKLTREAAMYHFVTGYTAKLAGTERGITEPQATFSTCFGAPFLPLPASRYAELLGQRIDEFGSNVYLVNTGWSGGPAGGEGKRMAIKLTRAMVSAALNGDLEKSEYALDETFNLLVPKTCPNVPDEVLAPRNTWADKAAYDKAAKELAALFVKNFAKYKGMPQAIIDAGPKA